MERYAVLIACRIQHDPFRGAEHKIRELFERTGRVGDRPKKGRRNAVCGNWYSDSGAGFEAGHDKWISIEWSV